LERIRVEDGRKALLWPINPSTVECHETLKESAQYSHDVMKLSFSLAKPKVAAPAAPPPSLKRPAAFALGDDDEPIDAAPTASSSLDKATTANKKLLAQNVQTSKAMQKRMEAEKRVDQTVYEYDEVWDKMQESKQRQKEAKELESKDRKVSH
jgi:hypothetical protein